MRNWILGLLFAVLLSMNWGCSGPAPVLSYPDGLYFDPDPELIEPSLLALEGLARATGADSALGMGVPIHAVDDLPCELFNRCSEEKPKFGCGLTNFDRNRETGELIDVYIMVDVSPPEDCWDIASTIQHEMIHALRRWLPMHEDQGHALTGVFSRGSKGVVPKLDWSSLLQVCEAMECKMFEPEPEPERLVVWPAAELVEATLQAGAQLAKYAGVELQYQEDGIPILWLRDLHHQGKRVDGVAHYNRWCAGSDCKGGNVDITMDWELVHGSKQRLLVNSIAHELVHVISGWGGCADRTLLGMVDSMHLPKGNIMSNGNDNYADMKWTDLDVQLARSCQVTK